MHRDCITGLPTWPEAEHVYRHVDALVRDRVQIERRHFHERNRRRLDAAFVASPELQAIVSAARSGEEWILKLALIDTPQRRAMRTP